MEQRDREKIKLKCRIEESLKGRKDKSSRTIIVDNSTTRVVHIWCTKSANLWIENPEICFGYGYLEWLT